MFLISINACKFSGEKQFNFYHWKAAAEYDAVVENALNICKTKKLYLHYFDIIPNEKPSWRKKDLSYPTYVLKSIDEEFHTLEIIPTVFITLAALKNDKNEKLAKKIKHFVHEISQHQFGKKIHKLQLDCDWTATTASKYFNLLELLKKDFELSTTIRLHQIKFPKKSGGIPPVEKGVLMVYNIGDLKNEEQNSILCNNTLKEYINTETKYPLKLDIALPLYSQTVIKSNENKVKILANVHKPDFEKNEDFFKFENEKLYRVVKDTIYKGFYLNEGFKIKLDQIKANDVIEAMRIIQNSKLTTDEIIFYHLDEATLQQIDLQKIIDEL